MPNQNLPGLDFITRSYDVFDEYARSRSVRLQLFDFGESIERELESGQTYLIPEAVSILQDTVESKRAVEAEVSLSNYQSSLSGSVGLEGKYGFFSGSINTEFSSVMSSFSEYSYASTRDTHALYIAQLDMSSSSIREYLTDSAREDIDHMPLEAFFSEYGSHYIKKVVVGGVYEMHGVMRTESLKSKDELRIAAKASYNNLVNSVRFEGEAETETAEELSTRFESTKTYILGGTSEGHQKVMSGDFDGWYEDVSTAPDVIGFTRDSIAPIWELASNNNRRDELLAYYTNEYLGSRPSFPDDDINITQSSHHETSIKESWSNFICHNDQFLVGMRHDGDENGQTRYYQCDFFCGGRKITWRTDESIVTTTAREANGDWMTAPYQGWVMVGRKHDGDENGPTTYTWAQPYDGPDKCELGEATWTPDQKQSATNFICPEGHVLVGRYHRNDENGATKYQHASIIRR